MSSIGPSTIASSFDRLLILPGGGGDGANLVSLSDGDNTTEFALKISTGGIAVDTNDKIYLDNGGNTYLTESSDGVLDIYSNGSKYISANANGNASNKEVVINEDGHDMDFRVQSDAKSHALIVDGSSGWVGINNAGSGGYPESYLHIKSNDRNDPHILCEGSSVNGFRLLADRYVTGGETQLNLGVTYSGASSYLASKVYGSTSVDYDSVGGWISSTDQGSYGGSAIVCDGGEGSISFWHGPNAATVATGSPKTLECNVKLTHQGNFGIGTTSPNYPLHVVGIQYQAGIQRYGHTGKTISGGTIDISANEGPMFAITTEGGGADDLDYITYNEGNPVDGMVIYLSKSTGTTTLRMGAHSGVTDGATAMQCVSNVGENEAFGAGLDGQTIHSCTFGNSYVIVQLIYKSSRWCVMGIDQMSNVVITS